ncbi:MAG: hypothetical protein DRP29_08185 [Thermodesulfobacteriota bacterium]|nr:MAG: hypothetical protein DRP29_08185 [Thermodesulfobacteriota bacterium]
MKLGIVLTIFGLLLITLSFSIKNKYGRYASKSMIIFFLILGVLFILTSSIVFYNFFYRIPDFMTIAEIVQTEWFPQLKYDCGFSRDKVVAVTPLKLNTDIQDQEALLASLESVFSYYIKLVERRRLKSVLSELAMQGKELFDPTKAAEVGKFLGANYVLVGEGRINNGKVMFLSLRLVNVETASFCGKSFTIICSVFKGCKIY